MKPLRPQKRDDGPGSPQHQQIKVSVIAPPPLTKLNGCRFKSGGKWLTPQNAWIMCSDDNNHSCEPEEEWKGVDTRP